MIKLPKISQEERDLLLGGEWSGPPPAVHCRCVVHYLSRWERFRAWLGRMVRR